MARSKGKAAKRNTLKLHSAIRKADIELVKAILLADPELNVNAVDPKRKTTALILACNEVQADIVNLLLDHQHIDVNAAHHKFGVTALIEACDANAEMIVRALLAAKHIDSNTKDNKKSVGFTALMYAASKGYTNVVGALLDHANTDVNATSTQHGFTALMCAARHRHIDTVNVLLTHEGINTRIVNKAGEMAYQLDTSAEIKKAIYEYETSLEVTAPNLSDPRQHVSRALTPSTSARPPVQDSSTSRTTDCTVAQEEGREQMEGEDWVMGGEKQQPPERHLKARSTFLEIPKSPVEVTIAAVVECGAQDHSKKRPISSTAAVFKNAAQHVTTLVCDSATTLDLYSVSSVSAVPFVPPILPARVLTTAPTVASSAAAPAAAPPVASAVSAASVCTIPVPLLFTSQTTVADDSTSTWLTDRMEKRSFSKQLVQICHKKLVEEQGFVQESLFAEMPENDISISFLSGIGIDIPGAQIFLIRLHRELRAQYFPSTIAANTRTTAVVTDKNTFLGAEPTAQRPRLA